MIGILSEKVVISVYTLVIQVTVVLENFVKIAT